jgi:hypothetical protein
MLSAARTGARRAAARSLVSAGLVAVVLPLAHPAAAAAASPSWSIVSSPNTGLYDSIRSISCTSSSFCMATGFSADNAGNQPTLVEKWDGTQWAIVSSPSPGSPYSYLLGVSCTSPSLCVSADSPS